MKSELVAAQILTVRNAERNRQMMTDSLRDRIAAVHLAHARLAPNDPSSYLIQQCLCGEWLANCTIDKLTAMWSEHVADAVIAELQLERQEHYDPSVSAHRFVTDWKADDE